MPKTERLYYTDCYLCEFEARVLRTEPATNGFKVYLDRTAFYPASGGQPADLGILAGIPVLEAIDEGDEIAHILAQLLGGDAVSGKVDWARRLDHMQQHTGQHILSAAFERTGGYKTVSFHMGEDISTIDLDSDRLGSRQLDEAEDAANHVVFEDRPVRIYFRQATEAGTLDLRKPVCREGDIRLVEVEGFDRSACGGTHVSRTGAVGLILIRKVDRMKGLTRVEFACGGRAHREARRDFRLLSEGARLFSAAPENVPSLIAKQGQELRDGNRERQKLIERLTEYEAKDLWLAAAEVEGWRIVRRVYQAEESVEARMVAHALAKQPSAVALIGVKGTPAGFIFAQTPGGPREMGGILKQTVAKFGGKGGGARDFAQGGGLDESCLDEALDYARSLVMGEIRS